MEDTSNAQWGTEHEKRSWADASDLMAKHPPHTITAILAQHISKNHGITEPEAWGPASELVASSNAQSLTAILAQHIQRGYEAGRFS